MYTYSKSRELVKLLRSCETEAELYSFHLDRIREHVHYVVESCIGIGLEEDLPGAEGFLLRMMMINDAVPARDWDVAAMLAKIAALATEIEQAIPSAEIAGEDPAAAHPLSVDASAGPAAEEVLSNLKSGILQAMHELKAFSSDSRVTGEEIARKAIGRDAEIPRNPLADLRDSGYLLARKGRGGGYWLTGKGMDRVQKLLAI